MSEEKQHKAGKEKEKPSEIGKENQHSGENIDGSRRNFLALVAGSTAAIGGGLALLPMLGSLQPADDVKALASVEVDISAIAEGQSKTIMWRGKPVFIRHRTVEEIEKARSVDMVKLPDPQTDEERVLQEKWLIVVGICTHLGCVPNLGGGDYDGWFCPCHGSHYDVSGRIRKGPAPKNLEVPAYNFINENTIKIG